MTGLSEHERTRWNHLAAPQIRHRAPAPRRTPADAARAAVFVGGELSITLGALLLLFVVWQLWWTDLTANRDQAQTTQQLEQEWQAAPAPAPAAATPEVDVPEIPGTAFAILRVPRFGTDYARPVVAGTKLDDLREGIGHYDDSAGPGEVGNFAIAGHRTTYGAPFFAIDRMVEGDPVVVQTAEGYYTYRVTDSEIVAPSEVSVIQPVPGETGAQPTEAVITLTSCHPRYSARQRYIVHGTLESFQPAAAGPPAVLSAG